MIISYEPQTRQIQVTFNDHHMSSTTSDMMHFIMIDFQHPTHLGRNWAWELLSSFSMESMNYMIEVTFKPRSLSPQIPCHSHSLATVIENWWAPWGFIKSNTEPRTSLPPVVHCSSVNFHNNVCYILLQICSFQMYLTLWKCFPKLSMLFTSLTAML